MVQVSSSEHSTSSEVERREAEPRYRIVLGDTCPVCRAASRITFTAEHPPQIPIVGCRDPGGCRCALPIFASELDETLAAAEPSLSALAPARGAPHAFAAGAESLQPAAGVRAGRAGASQSDWTAPDPVTQRRQHDLAELAGRYYQRRIQGIRVQTAMGCCRACAEVASSIYEPAVAPPLPVVGCWHGWRCRCMYVEEGLPLDGRGHAALKVLADRERERQLRRRGVARFAPRVLHEVMLAFAAMLALGAIWQYLNDEQPPLWSAVIPLVLAIICGGLALGAIMRLRPLPSPVWLDAVCGLVAAAIGLRSGIRLLFPTELRIEYLGQLAETHVSLRLTGQEFHSLADGERLLVAAGLALFVAALLALVVSPAYRRREATD